MQDGTETLQHTKRVRRPVAAGTSLIRAAFLWAVCVLIASTAVALEGTEEDLKAAYIFNFAKFTRWDDEGLGGPSAILKLCVVQDEGIAAKLKAAEGRKIGGHNIRSERLESIGDRQGCHVIYLGTAIEASETDIDLIVAEGRLLIAENASQGMIFFVRNRGRLQFSVNLERVNRARLKLSSDLLRLALSVEGKTQE